LFGIKRNYHTIITTARITHGLAYVYLKGVATHPTWLSRRCAHAHSVACDCLHWV